MSEKKKEAREALLGELESIKILLSEEEWEHIPLLDDPVTGPVPIVDASTIAELDPSTTTAAGTSLDINEPLDVDEDDIPVLEEFVTPTVLLTAVDAPPLPQDLPPSHQPQLDDRQVIEASSLPPAEVPLVDEPEWDMAPEVSEFGSESAPDATAGDAPRPFSPRTAELRARDLRPQHPGNKRPVVERRGENPFLPQHIRERLHTHKALVDIIKESPVTALKPTPPPESQRDMGSLPKVLPQEKLNQLIDGLVAVYLPKIEADLRTKLRQAFQADSSNED